MDKRESITIVLIPQKHNSGWTAQTTMNGNNDIKEVCVAEGPTATLALEGLVFSLRANGF